jgi:hypothetical protein
MMLRLALRSLTTRPLRSAILAAGFGLGIGVMVELLGVGEVILEQAHSPALAGGGDVVITSGLGQMTGARFLLKDVLGSARLREQVSVASPSRSATLYFITGEQAVPVAVFGGVPSLQRAVGDPEVAQRPEWRDEPADAAWINPSREDILRSLDRFHPIPASSPQPPASRRSSWAEWLYFNGRSPDGGLRFYLSFIATDADRDGMRPVFVRLQLDRKGRSSNYTAMGRVHERDLLAEAPDLDVDGNRVRLVGSQYRIALALSDGVTGDIALDATPGRSLPPMEIHGANGWASGYVAPVLAGTLHGHLAVGGETISVDGLAGYHDHNWGFWDGVHWQWGQVSSGDLSIVYGRVFPPASVADPDRIPGFFGVLGPDGPIGYSTNVTIREENDDGTPRAITVTARGERLEVSLRFTVGEIERTETFLQLGGVYEATGRAGDRAIAFTARGSAETFRLRQ